MGPTMVKVMNCGSESAAWQEALTTKIVVACSDPKKRKALKLLLSRAKRELKARGLTEDRAFEMVEECKAEAFKRLDFTALHPNFGGSHA